MTTQNPPSNGETQTLTLDDALRQAIQLHQAGHLDAAAQLYQAILNAAPQQPDANHNLGVIHFQRAQFTQALNLFQTALAGSSDKAQFWISYIDTLLTVNRTNDASMMLAQARALGIQHPALDELELRAQKPPITPHDQLLIDSRAGRHDKVMTDARKLIAENPADGVAWKLLGASLTALGQLSAAKEAVYKASQLLPGEAEIFNNLGVLSFRLNQLDDARLAFEHATLLDPEYADAFNNLGGTLENLGLHAQAECSCRKVLAIRPNHLDGLNNLAISLRGQRRFGEALPLLQQAHLINPNRADIQFNLAVVHMDLGRFGEAMPILEDLVAKHPEMASAHSNLGVSLLQKRQYQRAESCLQTALMLSPEDPDAYHNLGLALRRQERHDQAVRAFKQSLALSKTSINPDTYSNLGCALAELCRREEAVDALRTAHSLNPQDDKSFSNLLFILSQDDSIDAETLFAEHRRFAETFEAPLRMGWPTHEPAHFAGKPIRVGFVSADFNNHAIAFFIAPILRLLAADTELEIHIYDVAGVSDEMNQYLRGYLPNWHLAAGLNSQELAERIQQDKIVILLDLSSHTAGNRLMSFARKPAPIQVCWLGYPGTTGLQAMDYYLADRIQVPTELFEKYFTEKLVHLPVSATYMPPADEINVSGLPALRNGYVTFGSFNKASKITRGCVALWCRILHAVPTAKLILVGVHEGSLTEVMQGWFAAEGIGQERLTLHPRLPTEQYLKLFHEVDICLDTYPYNGGTTTLGALWMGVPTVTQVGRRIASRTGTGAMGHIELDAFIADSPDKYAQIAIDWADKIAELSVLRAQLRQRLLASPLCDPDIVGQSLKKALMQMYQHWQQGRPPASFEIKRHS